MILAIDIGNTNVVLAIGDGQAIRHQLRLETNADLPAADYSHEIAEWLDGCKAVVTGAIVASVVPAVTQTIVAVVAELTQVPPMVIGTTGVDLGIAVNIDMPEQAGADRLVNAVGALAHHPLPAIILDFGTATTLDLVGADGAYEGGIIAPGVALSITALDHAAAQLPRLELRPFDDDLPVLGKNTVAAMESGVFWGYVSMIEGLLERLRAAHGDMPAIATGGLAVLFAKHLSGQVIVDRELTIRGLFEIQARNR